MSINIIDFFVILIMQQVSNLPKIWVGQGIFLLEKIV